MQRTRNNLRIFLKYFGTTPPKSFFEHAIQTKNPYNVYAGRSTQNTGQITISTVNAAVKKETDDRIKQRLEMSKLLLDQAKLEYLAKVVFENRS